jgi:hypothetical protein
LWDGGQTTQTAVGLSEGTYNVTVTDANGCNVSTDLFSAAIISSTPPISDATATATNITCNGAADGMAIANASTGIAPYTYAWSDPGNQTTQTAVGLSTGTYTVTTTDVFGCFMTATTAAITDPPVLTANVTSNTPPTCAGGSDGTATAGASGGTGAYTYLWTPVGGTGVTGTGLSAGTTILSVSDTNGCMASDSVILVDPPAVVLSIVEATDPSCFGGSDGTITVSATGGPPPYVYSWNTTPSQDSSTATGLSDGAYTATVTDSAGCMDSINATITEPPELTLTTSTTNSACAANDGTATVTVTGGTGAYTYLWDDNNSQTTSTATGLGAGVYNVLVTDSNACAANASATVANANAPTLNDTSTNESCAGSANGSATVSASNGTPPYTYLWDDGLAQTTATANSLTAGTYNVVVTDANGCAANASSTVGTNGGPSVTTTSTDANCGNSDGTATATAIGGTAPYTYLWDDPGAQNTATAAGLAAGTYNITVSDAVGCNVVTSVNVSGPTALMAMTSSTATTPGNCTGTATANVTGGASPYTYLWNDPGTQSTSTATGLCAGDFDVVIVDTNGCSITETVTVSNEVGIGEIKNSFYWNIYPNPSSGDVFVELRFENEADIEIRVFNAIGEMISFDKLIHISDYKYLIKCSEYAGGIYYVHLLTEEEICVNKISILE